MVNAQEQQARATMRTDMKPEERQIVALEQMADALVDIQRQLLETNRLILKLRDGR